ALSSDAHGELVRLAAVLARLPGDGARAAELRLDSLLDDVSLVAAAASRGLPRDAAMPQVAEAAVSCAADPAPAEQRPRQVAALADAPASRQATRTPSARRTRALVVAGMAAAALVVIVAWSSHKAPVVTPVASAPAPTTSAPA